MEQTLITTVLLPLALGIIMLGLGLSLTIDDFKRTLVYPKAILIGLLIQVVLLPVLCYFIAIGFGLTSAIAVGLMLLAASPGGATANLYSHLANGDVALNITLTAINSVISLITLPIIVNFALQHFMLTESYIAPQFKKIIEVATIILIPVIIGMLIKSKKPNWEQAMNKPLRIFSIIVLVVLIAITLLKEKDKVADYFATVGLAALAFNLISMTIGYLIPQLFKINRKQSIAIGMEIGIHNGTLAIFIAQTVLSNTDMAIAPAIYSLIMFFTAGAFGWWISQKRFQ